MEGLTTYGTYLKNLLRRARRLTSSAFSLSAIFVEEANRLSRWDEASRLTTLCFSIRWQLDWLKSGEHAANYGYSQANLMVSLGGLTVGGIIKMVSRNEQLSAFADYVLKSPTNKERPFGLVLIYIGPKGLPDDAGVVSISQSARESNQEEFQVINALQERGHLLLSEKAFSLLVDRLVDDVREGRLRLPISRETLSEITASGESEPDVALPG